VDGNLAVRRRAVPAVEAMVEEAVAAFTAWERGLAAEPAVRALRQRFEEIRREELAKNLKRVPEGAREATERLTESLVNRLLHEPSESLRQAGREGGSAAGLVDALRRLFGIRGEP
jgi:glutamyl-tRNA reductase